MGSFRRRDFLYFTCATTAFSQSPPVNQKEIMAQFQWGEGKLRPGDPAPDFHLKVQKSNRRVKLSKLRGKPVALVFGSFT